MLTVAEAVERILADVARGPVERVALPDALGRVLAAPAISPITIPAWDNSAMDGYAVRAADVEYASAEAPVTLPVLETIAAGRFPSQPLAPGSATRIMTGAPLPEGADTVVRVEDTDGGTSTVVVRNARDARKNVRYRGEDIREGARVMEPGTPVHAAQLGVLASIGYDRVDVYARPRVAILTSGDELVDLDRFDEVRAGRKIVSSNSYTLDALVRAAGGVPVHVGTARDDPVDIRARLDRAADCDLIVTSAGISVGEFDHLRRVLDEMGVELKFWRVRMRPGAPLGFGLLRGRPWIGLPGNPVSTMVTFDLFVRPAIRRMLGHERLFRRPVRVTLEEPVSIGARLTHFLRATVRPGDDGQLLARLTGPQGSGILTSMARAEALLIVPEERPRLEAGESVHAFLLTEDTQLAAAFSM
ncbi:MAG TPA: gephyrin-like molybdotransferase Glp [Gemmatimonadaceae bacterium]|nr:gephyrin-like molybdotransferase Glp [Gemmatimonadaceae bacterium]